MKTHEEDNVKFHIFLTSAIGGSEYSDSHPGCFTPVESFTGSWLRGPQSRCRLFDAEKNMFILPAVECMSVDRFTQYTKLISIHMQ